MFEDFSEFMMKSWPIKRHKTLMEEETLNFKVSQGIMVSLMIDKSL